MFWTIKKIFGWRFTCENWGLGFFWRLYFRKNREEYLVHLKKEIKVLVQRWYLLEKKELRDKDLLVVGVVTSWVILRAYPEHQAELVTHLQKEVSQRVMWLEGGL
tara:strand:+ start:433 stop:747 length:315 start_codon:yes stop_codon:yes gene_type:complete